MQTMYMNLKPNQHKSISFNTTTMTPLGFIGPLENFSCPLKFSSPAKFNFLLRSPPNYFCLKFLGLPLKLGGEGCYHAKSFATVIGSFPASRILV